MTGNQIDKMRRDTFKEYADSLIREVESSEKYNKNGYGMSKEALDNLMRKAEEMIKNGN